MLALPPAIGDAPHQVIHGSRMIEKLAGTRVPVLAIASAEDHAYPQPISGENIARATGDEHVSVAGAGHSVALERGKEVATHLEDHVAAAGS